MSEPAGRPAGARPDTGGEGWRERLGAGPTILIIVFVVIVVLTTLEFLQERVSTTPAAALAPGRSARTIAALARSGRGARIVVVAGLPAPAGPSR